MKKILFFVLVLLIANKTYAQTYFNFRFEYEQPGIWDGATNVFILPDGYVLAGGTGTGIDNDYPRIGFYKMNFTGNKIFSKVYGGTMCFVGNPGSIIRLNDTLIVVSGSRKILQTVEYNEGILLFMTNSFDTLFTKSFGDKIIPNDTCTILNQVKKTESKQIITVGSEQICGYYNKIILMKTTNTGDLLWKKRYGGGIDYQGHSVICTADGGYAIGGFAWSASPPPNNSGDPVVVKTDSVGNQQWMKNLGGPYPDYVAMLTHSIDGNIIIGTCYCDSIEGGGPHADGNPFRRINLVKIDNSGTILWNKKYGQSEYFKTLANIRMNIDGSLIATGVTHHSKEFSSKDFGWILKTTADGDSLWYREYAICDGEDSNNWLLDVIETLENGYLACGVVYPMPPDTGSQDGWVIKVDSLGCEAPGECWVGVKPANKFISNGFDLYPNPVSAQQTNIQLRITDYGLRLRIRLFDLFGREVRNIIVPSWQTEYQLDVSELPAGLYVAVVDAGDKIIGREKLVVE